jgi:hypothetical protein
MSSMTSVTSRAYEPPILPKLRMIHILPSSQSDELIIAAFVSQKGVSLDVSRIISKRVVYVYIYIYIYIYI